MQLNQVNLQVVLLLALADQLAAKSSVLVPAPLRQLQSQGIVVPKRSQLIVSLNQQFKQLNKRQENKNQDEKPQEETPNAAPRPTLAWLAQSNSLNTRRQHNHQSLYLDRHQQEILAANPNLLNPSSVGSSGQLNTRSDASPVGDLSSGSFQLTLNSSSLRPPANSPAEQQQHNSQQQLSSDGQQLYRGYSLIELEVKSESDRRYVQDLYGNLSAALNEQAQNPNSLTVSPYVDVDFWSFKSAVNDQIDIMVSPKSRQFILSQLSRAKIKHRIKIDDIQARLDSQQLNSSQASASYPATSRSINNSNSQQLSAASRTLSSAKSADVLSGRFGASELSADAKLTVRQEQQPAGAMNDSQFFDNYQRLADINQYVESMVEKNPDVAKVNVIGRSSQGRYLRVLKLGYDQQSADGSTGPQLEPAGDSSRSKPTSNATDILNGFFRRQEAVQKLGSIWLDGGTHAREWISPATVLYLAFRLSDNHNRCNRFFDSMRALVAASQQQRQGRHLRELPAELDSSLVSGINEINTSLLGKPVAELIRARTELEHTVELLAKNPQEVASEHGCDLDMDQLLRRYTFYIMPVLNPDGYEYSHTHNRLWRKTRSQSSHPLYRHFCLGADPNRNYDARHASTGSSTHPCSQTFAGNVPFTEPETRHQSNFVYANRLGMKMYISFHSYSQMILLPFSHSKQLAPDHKDLDSVGQAAVKAIERTHGTVYRVGPSASILYTASGTASDWAYEKAGIKYSYTMELRDTGAFGFLLPRQQIIPTGEETFNGLLAMIGQMEKNDNLLTSKSLMRAQTNNSSGNQPDLSHVPEADQLRPFSAHRPQSPLENVLDADVGAWTASKDLSLSGVRDRKPTKVLEKVGSLEDVGETTEKAQPSSWPSEMREPTDNHLHDDPLEGLDEPDSGYAFEGEGELMEPTRDNVIESVRLAERKQLGRQDHSRRIAQSVGLTASGRNLVNSPLTSRLSPAVARRESSDHLPEVGR